MNLVRKLCTKRVLVCPGQGIFNAECLGLFNAFSKKSKTIKSYLETADQSLQSPISQIITENSSLDGSILQKTSIQQPLLILADYIIMQALREFYHVDLLQGPKKVDLAVGHSLGEITALTVQNSLKLSTALELAEKRGLFMEETVAELGGGFKMYALVFPASMFEFVRKNLVSAKNVCISNINGYEQIAITGKKKDCESAIEALKASMMEKDAKMARRLKAVDLMVSIPFHNTALDPVKEKLSMYLKDITNSPLSVPIVSNINGQIQHTVADHLRNVLDVTSKPVNFVSCLETILQGEERVEFINLGPGKVTFNLIKKFAANKGKDVGNYLVDNTDGMDELARVW